MKQSLVTRWLVIGGVLAFMGYMAFKGVAQDGLELGIDLKGGSELIFKFEFQEEAAKSELLKQAIGVIQQRIDGFGLKDIVIQPIGEDTFAVQVSAKDKEKVDAIKALITDLGRLEFRITVEPDSNDNFDHYWTLFKQAEAKGLPDDQARAILPRDLKPDDKARYPEGLRWYPLSDRGRGRYEAHRRARDETGVPQPYVLCEADIWDINGDDLYNVFHARDQGGLGTGWAVYFSIRKLAQANMAALTEFEEQKHMAIILNGEVDSAPILKSTLSDSGQITGGFTEAEARSLAAILQAGALKEKPTLASERTIAPDLAGDAKQRGILSIGLGFLLVMVMMAWLYYGPGMLANLALLLNLVILLGVLTWFEAVLTLPGLAGVVLTVGMAVDANILVFERIKEERARGRTIGQAIATGYDRALVTIIDSNLTTLITAYFLFQIGSGPVRGFGITLAVGIVASMFTALYVTRTIFEYLLRKGTVTEARMRGEWSVPAYRWTRMMPKAVMFSTVAMVAGAVLWEGVPDKVRYDLDFTEGSKLIVRFHERQRTEEVRAGLAAAAQGSRIYRDIAVRASAEGIGAEVGPEGSKAFELRSQNISTQEDIEAFAATLRKTFAGKLLPGPFQSTIGAGPAGGATGVVHYLEPNIRAGLLQAAFEQFSKRTGRLEGARAEKLPDVAGAGSTFRVSFRDPADNPAAVALNVRQALAEFDLAAAKEEYAKAATSEERTPTEQEEAKAIVDVLGLYQADQLGEAFFEECDPFPLADRIDPTTAQEHRDAAVQAIALSILGIIIYVAFRFRSWAFGFAAVVALVHDVLVSLGLVALVNWLGIIDARLNLVTVAAFLTLIGYSINDTIVIFDRIRENRGAGGGRTRLGEIIDHSVNQTLSRTLRTSGTTWIVVAILLALNYGANSPLEGFAFILVVGVIVGTYSTVFIASPTLLFLPWLWERCGRRVKIYFRHTAPYMVGGAVVLLLVEYLRNPAAFQGDFSVAFFDSLLLAVPVGVLAHFLLNFIRFVREEQAAAAAQA